jgi:hypothetical protein
MTELKHIEKTRRYFWNDEMAVYLKGVTHFSKVKNEHHLRTLDGKQHIIGEGWIHIEIDATEEVE